jgi:D-glycero-D-manno-heptose 1,7-bisphosphate phosphatase
VLNRRVVDGYVTEPHAFELQDLVLEAAVVALDMGAAVVVVTNQGAIGRGLVSEAGIMAIHARLLEGLRNKGIELDGIYICPHHPRAIDPAARGCGCRKPNPGLILAAAQDLNIDLASSGLIGDQASDVAAAVAAGISEERTLLVGDAVSADAVKFVREAFKTRRGKLR